MSKFFFLSFLMLLVFTLAGDVQAGPARTSFPAAGARSHAQNYRDMVMATCLANAYKGNREVAIDAGSSVSALRDWTLFDMDNAPDEVRTLVDSFLARDYRNPIVEAEIKGVRFDLLKCLDLYHSRELDTHIKRYVIEPGKTSRSSVPAAGR